VPNAGTHQTAQCHSPQHRRTDFRLSTDLHRFAGTHNSSQLTLFWESDSPVTVNKDLHLTEYRLVNLWSNFTVANYSLTAEVSTSFGLHSRVYGKFGE
jgi:hypothetical protein